MSLNKFTTAVLEPEVRGGKFYPAFDIYDADGVNWCGCTSGFGFPTREEAIAATRRAEQTMQSTGKLPNMCEEF